MRIWRVPRRDRLAVLGALVAPLALVITARQQPWDAVAEGFPPGTDTELLVEGGGVFQGRFLMTPSPGARPTLEQRQLADQVGAALAASHPVGQG